MCGILPILIIFDHKFHCPQIQTNEHDDSPTERLVEHDPWIPAAYVMFRFGVEGLPRARLAGGV